MKCIDGPLSPTKGALGHLSFFNLLIGVVGSSGSSVVVLLRLSERNLPNKPGIEIIRTCILTFSTLIQVLSKYTVYMYFDNFDIGTLW